MRSTRGAVVGLVAVAAAIALVVGTVACGGGDDEQPIGAVAAVQDDHLPVDPIENIPARLDLVADTGATTTRVRHLLGARSRPRGRRIRATRPTRPTTGRAPTWCCRASPSARITPIVSVYNAPAWATGGRYEPPGYQINTAAPDPDDFADFMAALATRYSGGFASPGRRDAARAALLRDLERAEPPGLLPAPVRGRPPRLARHATPPWSRRPIR